MAEVIIVGDVHTQNIYESTRERVRLTTEDEAWRTELTLIFEDTRLLCSAMIGYLNYLCRVRHMQLTLIADNDQLYDSLHAMELPALLKLHLHRL